MCSMPFFIEGFNTLFFHKYFTNAISDTHYILHLKEHAGS